MADWTKSMNQSFEYYIVDPGTWKEVEKLDNIKSSTINRDIDTETLESASIDVTETVGECYIRIYLITVQNGVKERHPLGTFLVQTPSSSYDGRIRNVTMDAYSPLLELKEKKPPIGYYLPKDEIIMNTVYRTVRENVRAPVIQPFDGEIIHKDYVANVDETYLSYLIDLMSNAKCRFYLDEFSRISFAPIKEIDSLQPVWIYNDDNSSILLPDITMDHDLYGIPNVVEVVYTNGNIKYEATAINDDINSPTSIVNRGRKIIHRVTNIDLPGIPTENQTKLYAENLLKELSSVEYTVSYTHGYCPVRLGDCVMLNYEKAGLTNIKAKVISQSIKCSSGCQVSERAVFTKKLWK